MLEIENLEVGYGTIKALHGVSLRVNQGSIVTLIGANGAGKSTTLRAISGLIKARGGKVRYDGEDITNLPPHAIVARGLCHVPEGRMVFANLTVEENLRMGAYLRKDKPGVAADMEIGYEMFPRLRERRHQAAGRRCEDAAVVVCACRDIAGPRLAVIAAGHAVVIDRRLISRDGDAVVQLQRIGAVVVSARAGIERVELA